MFSAPVFFSSANNEKHLKKQFVIERPIVIKLCGFFVSRGNNCSSFYNIFHQRTHERGYTMCEIFAFARSPFFPPLTSLGAPFCVFAEYILFLPIGVRALFALVGLLAPVRQSLVFIIFVFSFVTWQAH